VAPNFRGEVIPKAYGLAITGFALPMLLLDAFMFRRTAEDRLIWAVCISVFSALGLLDDLVGDKKVKGFRGHLSALVQHSKFTTGLVKAIGGMLAALAVGVYLHRSETLHILLVAGIIALCANTTNLLDLRPGRACGVFWALSMVVLLAIWPPRGGTIVPGLWYVVVPALVVWIRDAKASVMLGDTGSNLLGASIGLAVCLYLGVAWQVGALILALAVNILAERRSITQLIDQNPVLRTIDRMTGVR
jgi:UDP-N-acetylmuramyl pentapeptide phosphotransferase/UDP-N-acetylglucosamine-1-phosphate transferase